MKLFIIIYVAGQIGGYAGPLPYDETECHKRIEEMVAGKTEQLKEAKMEFKCEKRFFKPKLEVKD